MADTGDNLHFLDYWRVIQSRKEIVIAVSLIVVVTGILVTLAMPKVYTSSVIVQVKEEQPDVELFTPQMMRYDPLYLRTQFEIIQSAPVIEEVIQKLDLTQVLGSAYGYLEALGPKSFDQTLKILSRSIKVQQYRDTNLIEIQAYLSEPRERVTQVVADVANMMAVCYRNQSSRRSRDATERALAALYESLQEQKRKVETAEEELERVRKEHKLDIINYGGTDGSLSAQSISELESRLITLRLELEDKRSRYEEIKSRKGDDLRAVAPYVVGDPALAALVATKREAEVELERLVKAALGPRHPDIIQAQATISELDSKIDEALIGLRAGVAADFAAAQAKYDAITQMLDEKKTTEREAEGSGYREFDKAKDELAYAQRIRDSLEVRYLQERIEMRIPRTTVQVIEPAKAPPTSDPVKPDLLLNIILSVIVGLGAGVGLAYFIEYLDTSVKTIEDIERVLGLKVLGVIPQKVLPLIDPDAESAHAEAYRVLRTNIQFAGDLGPGGRALCITSGSVGEGKSLTLFNLAYTCAQLGEKVLVIDSDLHRPRQHKIMGVSNKIGLANVLMGSVSFDDAVIDTGHKNFHFLPSGRIAAGTHGLMGTEELEKLIVDLKKRYDVVFFDSPPIIGVSDASLLVRTMDAVLMVVQHRKYPRAISSRARDMINNVGGNLMGVVLNNINISRDHTYYYYQQHYYYYPRGGKKSARREKQADEPGPEKQS